ncbi:MAG: molecular chaperone DnaK, partial [Methylococcaceae bacterium]
LHCVTVDPPERRWSIEFQLRGAPRALASDATDPRLAPARERILQVFGKKTRDADPKSVKTLRQELEKLLGPRAEWDTPVLRELFAALLEGLPNRRRSAEHERLWLSLVGFSLRPGFGYPLDDWRVEQIFSLYQQGLQFVNESQNWAEWWTLWRRIAGGLNPLAQQKICDDLADFINPEAARRGNLPTLAKKRSYEDMVRLVAVLERLPALTKVRLGDWLLQRLAKPAEPVESWWALGRIGSREPFHGSAHEVVPTATAEAWLKRAMQHDFRKQPQPAFAAALLARRSGDRARDIDSALRDALLEQLRAARSPESWQTMVTEFRPLSEADVKRIYGEALPPGLALIG